MTPSGDCASTRLKAEQCTLSKGNGMCSDSARRRMQLLLRRYACGMLQQRSRRTRAQWAHWAKHAQQHIDVLPFSVAYQPISLSSCTKVELISHRS